MQAIDEISGLVREAQRLLGALAPWAPLVEHAPGTVLADERASALAPLLSNVPSLVGLAEGLIEATGDERRSGPHRPARLYTVKDPSDVPYAPVIKRA